MCYIQVSLGKWTSTGTAFFISSQLLLTALSEESPPGQLYIAYSPDSRQVNHGHPGEGHFECRLLDQWFVSVDDHQVGLGLLKSDHFESKNWIKLHPSILSDESSADVPQCKEDIIGYPAPHSEHCLRHIVHQLSNLTEALLTLNNPKNWIKRHPSILSDESSADAPQCKVDIIGYPAPHSEHCLRHIVHQLSNPTEALPTLNNLLPPGKLTITRGDALKTSGPITVYSCCTCMGMMGSPVLKDFEAIGTLIANGILTLMSRCSLRG